MSDIRYSWRDGAKSVGISEEVQLPQFKIQGHVQKASEISLSTGNYSRLICEIRFVRSMGYYLIQIYVPAGLIVVISWVSSNVSRLFSRICSPMMQLPRGCIRRPLAVADSARSPRENELRLDRSAQSIKTVFCSRYHSGFIGTPRRRESPWE